MAERYVQEVLLTRMDVPTIDGFQCPTWSQGPGQNSLIKALSLRALGVRGSSHLWQR